MEKMQMALLSVRQSRDQCVVVARADARDAVIHIRARFVMPPSVSREDLWREARHQVLRYLDLE